MSIEKIERGNTLWGFAKEKLKQAQGNGAKITNQQIIDAMKAIATAKGYDGDYEQYAKETFIAGNEIDFPGLCIESDGSVKVQQEEDAAAEEEVSTEVAEDELEDGSESEIVENTTLGAAGTFMAKGGMKTFGYWKKGIGYEDTKTALKKQGKAVASTYKKGFKKLEGKVAKAKAQSVRNTAAGKASEYRKALNNWKAENDKLKELKNKQNKLKTAKQKMNKLKPGIDKDGKKITDKKLIETRKANKAKGLEKVNKEIEALQKEIDKQKDKVGKANAKKVTTKETYSAAKRKVTKDVNKTVGRTASGKIAKKTATKAATKAATKTTAKTVAKAGGKTLLKKIPGVSLIAGAIFAADRAMHGDYSGAAAELASGAASCVPGIGTGVSVAIDAGLAYKDLKDAKVI